VREVEENIVTDGDILVETRVCNQGLPELENPGNPNFFQTQNPGLNGLPSLVLIFLFFIVFYCYLRKFMSKMIYHDDNLAKGCDSLNWLSTRISRFIVT